MQDLLIKNGRLIDPTHNLDAPLDVSFANGQVAAITAPGKNAQASETIDALSRVTSIPAATIKMKDELGTFKVGATADATILRLCEGKRKLEDTVGKVETIEQWLEPVYVVKGGRVVAQHN